MKEKITFELNGETLELVSNGGGCCACRLNSIGVDNFAFGEIAECVKITNNLCTKSMGAYFKLKKEVK